MNKLILVWNIIKTFFLDIKQKVCPFCEEESDLAMAARDLGIISEEFERLYGKLTEAEDHLKDIANRYAIGEKDVRMKDVDEAFSDLKKPMGEIRKLAVEAREHKESDDQ